MHVYMYVSGHSTACVVLLYPLLQIHKSNSISHRPFHHSICMLVHVRLLSIRYISIEFLKLMEGETKES